MSLSQAVVVNRLTRVWQELVIADYSFDFKQVIFYSSSALLAMQSAVPARGILSVRPSDRPSVCLSDTFRYCVQKNEDTIVRFSSSGSTIPLVCGEVKFIRIFAGDHPQRGR